MKVSPDRLPKGRLKMRSLATSIRNLYDALRFRARPRASGWCPGPR